MIAADGPLDLVEAAMLIAAEEYPSLDVEHHVGRVRTICGESARRARDQQNPFARFDRIRSLLFEELEFRGNVEDFSDPRNSYLNEVLDRRLGIPLTLSILLMECADAAGFEVRGVGLPGHFVTRLAYAGRTFFIDPYNGGRVITEDDCRELVVKSTGRPSLFRRELLEGTDSRSMLFRLLLNLKHVFVKRKDYVRALRAVERLLLIRPADKTELRDRGFLQAYLGRPSAAIRDLERYLADAPDAPDAESVRGRVSWLRRRISHFN